MTRVIIIIASERASVDSGTVLRIISARNATKHEHTFYIKSIKSQGQC